MKIVNIIGGLGNQMFQYAFALSLKYRYENEDVLIDTHHFNHYKLHNGFELASIFENIEIGIAHKNQLKKVTRYISHYNLSRLVRKFFPILRTEYIEKKDYRFDNKVYSVVGDCYYEGYWQSYAYYANIKPNILSAFKFPKPSFKNQRLAEEIYSCNSVGIHIRRGDYLNHKDFKGICELDYYQRAINDLLSNNHECSFYIFSNDIQWCKENIHPLLENHPVNYVTQNSGINSCWDMFLMSKCNHLIIANSSFSWWGAFLNDNNGRIYAPTKWVNRDYDAEIFSPNWIRI